MRIVNFSHPLTAQQLAQIEAQLGEKVDGVRHIRVQFDVSQPFVPQVIALVDSLGITAEQWQSEAWLIVPPSLNFITAILLAELHGRSGRFPTIVRLRPIANALVSAFEVAEIINLDDVRQPAPTPAPEPTPTTPAPAPAPVLPAPAREWRKVEYVSQNGRFGVVLYAEWSLTGSGLSKRWQLQPVRGRVEIRKVDGFTHVRVIEEPSSDEFIVVTNGKGGADARTPDGRDCAPIASLTGDAAVQVFALPLGSVLTVYGYKRRSSRTQTIHGDGTLKDLNPFD